MRDLAILTFLTLDGVMQAPGGPEEDPSGGFMHGGWARNCWDDVMEQVMGEAMAAPYDLLLGRKTYEGFAAHWPDAGNDPAANTLNNATKFVATSTLSKLEWKNSVRVIPPFGDAIQADQKTLPRPPHTSKRTPVVHWSRLLG